MRKIAAVLALTLAVSGGAWAEDPAPPGELGFVASNLVSTANGTFHSWRVVSARVDPREPASGEVVVEVDVASLDTGIEQRDDHLRSADFFEVERWPTARARVHGVRRDGQSDRGHPRYRASFDVTIRDVRKTLEGSFELVSSDPPTVEGELTLDRLEFGIGGPPSWWNPMSITQQVPVRFRAALSPGS